MSRALLLATLLGTGNAAVQATPRDAGVAAKIASLDPAPARVLHADAADSAIVAEYRLRDRHGERRLVLVRDATRIEYRIDGEPVQRWRQTPDGIEHEELFAQERRSIAFAPGDLRTIGEMPDWVQLAGLTDPALRNRLARKGTDTAFRETAVRYRGQNPDKQPVLLDWLEHSALPAHYRVGARQGDYDLRLRTLHRAPAATAFTATTDYRETDYADLGDMELDPFAARYLKRHGH